MHRLIFFVLFLLLLGAVSADEWPLNLGPEINTTRHEAMPCISGNQKVLIYQTDYIVDSGGLEDMHLEENWDLWVADGDGQGNFENTRILTAVNSDFFDGQASLSVDGKTLYFTSNRPIQGKKGKRNMNLWVSHSKGGTWQRPTVLPAPINTDKDETFPSINWSGTDLYFGRPDGIYVAKKKGDKWLKPKKLPKVINRGYGETASAIHADDESLYFSSRRPGGSGLYDIYLSRRVTQKKKRRKIKRWSKPINLGLTINGKGDDLYVSIPALGDLLYYSSTRLEGNGGEDLYAAPIPAHARPNLVTLTEGTVINKYSKKAISAEIEITDLETGKRLQKLKTDKNGKFSLLLNANRWFGVVIEAKKHFFLSDNIDLRNRDPFKKHKQTFALIPIGVSGNLSLKNIFFKTGSYKIKKQSRADLKRLAKLLQANKKVKLEIQGHTDNVGSKKFSKKLSQKRAKEVLKYLVKYGADKKRLIAVGYGEEKPIATNDTKNGRAKNRRTEFVILE